MPEPSPSKHPGFRERWFGWGDNTKSAPATPTKADKTLTSPAKTDAKDKKPAPAEAKDKPAKTTKSEAAAKSHEDAKVCAPRVSRLSQPLFLR